MASNKMYIFFLVLCLLFWNPLTYLWVYGKTPVRNTPDMLIVFALLCAAGLLAVWLLSRNQLGERWKNRAVTAAFTGILFALLVGFDGLVGFVAPTKEHGGLVFEPNTEAHYQTKEFDITAKTNSLGLRDREVSVDKGDKYRVLCFGDSWTFGWGVDAENSWPKKLESHLQANGIPNAEVINCGQGGQYPSVYLKYMEKAVPMLKPDLVLVGVLQGDDLAQEYESRFMGSDEMADGKSGGFSPGRLLRSGKQFLKSSFANTLAAMQRSRSGPVDVRKNWEQSAAGIIGGLTPIQKLRFESLDKTMQDMFRTGDINPAILSGQVQYPERIIIFNDPEHPATQFALQTLDKDLKGMKAVCEANGSRLVFCNMPTSYFTGHQVVGSRVDEIAKQVLPYENQIDSMYRAVSTGNGVPYVEMTEHFARLEDKNAYFFRYDGHPNERGYAEIARVIGEQLLFQNKLNLQ
ncbi:MAG: SGNH/GDSL hydrolase family protein [Saprospiraceae bacterium]|nr:SGNH/GDSL hydrolase family protein [Saprospiraceae bacterium]